MSQPCRRTCLRSRTALTGSRQRLQERQKERERGGVMLREWQAGRRF